jgi:hypothetical protein
LRTMRARGSIVLLSEMLIQTFFLIACLSLFQLLIFHVISF